MHAGVVGVPNDDHLLFRRQTTINGIKCEWMEHISAAVLVSERPECRAIG
jgi:hypothetical protein